MADRKLTQLPILVSADTTDLVYVVDVSDTSESPQGTSKKTTVAGLGSSKADLVNGTVPISQIPQGAINVLTFSTEELFPPVGAYNTVYIGLEEEVAAYWDGDEYRPLGGEDDFLTGGTASTVTGSAEYFNVNGDTFTVDGFAKLSDTIVDGVTDTAPTSNAVFDALALKENLANKTNTFTPYDGTGTKYPTFDLANSTFINNAKLASQTGFVSATDTVELSALTSTTLRIKATNPNGVFFSNGLNSPTAVYTDGFKTFPQTDYPLTQLVTATGTNVNVNPIVVDGLHIRFVGYNINGGVVSSATSFKNNSTVAQLGYVAVQKSGSSVTFVGGIATGGINVFTQVYLSNTNSLVLDSVRLNSTVAIGLNSGTSLSNTAGVVNGASINWHQGTNNVGNVNSINERSIQSNTDLPFFSIDATTASATTTPVPLTSWTQTVNGIAIRDSFYNSTTGQRDTLNNNTFSVKQLLLSQAGRFYLKEGVHTSAAGYASMDIAKASLPTAVFPVSLLPAGTNVEIGRIAFKKGFVNTTDVTEFVFYPTTAAAGGSSVVQTIADATTSTKGIVQLAGDIAGTATNIKVTGVNNGTPYTALGTGLVKNTTGTGQHTIAIPDSDYATTGFVMSKIVQTIINGDTGHTPSSDVIYDALVGLVDGTGTTGYIPQFTGGTSIVQSQIFQHTNGNVSVGGTNPTAGKLEVIDTNFNPAYIVAASNDEFNYAGLQLTNVDYSQRWMLLHKAQAGVLNNLAFDYTSSAGTVNAMNIKSNGNVLIGTTADTGNKVTVNGNILSKAFIKSGATAGNILLAGGTDIPQSTFATASGNGNYIQNQKIVGQTADYWINGTAKIENHGISDTTALRIETETNMGNWAIYCFGAPNYFQGQVLIGSDFNATGAKLQVNGGASFTSAIRGESLMLTGNRILEYASDSDNAEIGMNFYGYAESTSRFRNFVVYDGKTNPILTVNGSTSATTFNGNVIAKTLIKAGGTSTQFLKADGSVDSTTYAIDSNVLHKTGNETKTGVLTLNPTVNAATALARGMYLNPTEIATANNDVLVGLDINPTFTNGAFTGVTNLGIRSFGTVRIHAITGGILDLSGFGAGSGVINVPASGGSLLLQSNSVTGFQMFGSRNILLQNGGTFTDAGYRLDVKGSVRFTTDNNDTPYTSVASNGFTFGSRGTGTAPMFATRSTSVTATGLLQLAIQNTDVARTNESDILFRTGVELSGAIQSVTSSGTAFAFQNATTNLFTISRQGTLNISTAPTTSAGGYDIITRNTSTGVVEKVASNTYALASTAHNPVTIGTANGLSLSTQVLSLGLASTSTTGALSSTDWNTFNNKTSNLGTVTSVAALTLGTTGTDANSSVANSTTTPVITLNLPSSSAANRGLLTAADWTTFNNKLSTISGIAAGGELSGTYPNPTLLNSAVIGKVLTGYVSGAGTVAATDTILQAINKLNGNNLLKADKTITISTTAPLTGGGDLSANRTIAMPAATTSVSGYLTSTDWNTFNSKAAGSGSGSYIQNQNASAQSANMWINGQGTFATVRYGNGTSSIGLLSYGTGLITLEASSTNTSIALMPSGTGNVNVGTPLTATQKLNVQGNIMSIDAKNQYLVVGMESDVAVLRTDWFSGAGGAARPMAFHTQGAERMRIHSNGNVGIGATNPADKLQVVGNLGLGTETNVNSPQSIIFRSNITDVGGYLGGMAFYNFQWDSLIKASINGVCDGLLKNGALVFNTSSGDVNAVERMRIKNNGNVLIGTTTDTTIASHKLQVAGMGYFSQGIQIGGTSNSPFTSSSWIQANNDTTGIFLTNASATKYAGLKTDGAFETNGKLVGSGVISNAPSTFQGATGNNYSSAGLQVLGNGGTNTIFPTLGFHQPSMFAGEISMKGNGVFSFTNGDGVQRASINVNNINASALAGTNTRTVVAQADGTLSTIETVSGVQVAIVEGGWGFNNSCVVATGIPAGKTILNITSTLKCIATWTTWQVGDIASISPTQPVDSGGLDDSGITVRWRADDPTKFTFVVNNRLDLGEVHNGGVGTCANTGNPTQVDNVHFNVRHVIMYI